MKKPAPIRVPTLLSALVLVLTTAYALLRYSALPELIPIRFNGAGEAVGFGARGMIFLYPAVALLFWGVLTLVASSKALLGHLNLPFPVPDTARAEVVDLSRAMIAWMTCALTALLCIPSVALIHGSVPVMNVVIAVCLAAMAAAAVFYLIKIRRVCRAARPWDTEL